MIRIFLDNPEKLSDWYKEKLTEHIMARPITATGGTKEVQAFEKRLEGLTEEEIGDILALTPKKLEEKYDWIQEYIRLCEFCSHYSDFRRESVKKKKLRERREEYLQKHWGKYLEEHVKKCGEEETVRSWKKTDEVRRWAEELLQQLNEAARQKFDYSLLDETGIRGELVRKMNIPVCPYCNKQYIQAFSVGENIRYLGDLDHVKPKSIYQLFSISLWNLVPSCKACNQLFKRVHTAPILDPYTQGFDEDCILRINYRDILEMAGEKEPEADEIRWEIQPGAEEEKRKLLQNSLDLFHLNESYRCNGREISRVLKRRRKLESAGYRKSVGQLEGMETDFVLEYGVSLEPRRFQEELLSKAIYDVVEHN